MYLVVIEEYLLSRTGPHSAPGLFKFASPAPMQLAARDARQVTLRANGNAGFHNTGARDKLNSKRINGVALEMIMRDVLHGMQGFTTEVSSGSETGRMEILAVEEAENTEQKATVIPFPGSNRK